MGLSKEELIILLTVELADADRDLTAVETEIGYTNQMLNETADDLNILIAQRDQIVERRLQLKEDLRRAKA